MKTRKILSMLFAILLVFSCVLPGLAVEPVEGEYTYAHASRPFLASSFEELIENSEAVLIGKVVGQRTELRHDLVFTYNIISVKKLISGNITESTIEVLQTGGTHNGVTSPELWDEPLMDIGETYFLCVRFSPADGTYGEYYLPVGGGQGIISFTEMAQETPTESYSLEANAEAVFFNRDYGCTPQGGLYGDVWTNGHWWLDVCDPNLDPSLDLTFSHGSTTYAMSNMIKINLRKWNTNGIVTLTYSSSENTSEIIVEIVNYGNVNWEAETAYSLSEYDPYYGTGSGFSDGIYRNVRIQLNEYFYDIGEEAWKGIICHEGGHALGLGHITPSDDRTSVMVPATSSRVVDSPNLNDFANVIELYEGVAVEQYELFGDES